MPPEQATGVAVIIPFFQRQTGILRRAVVSVARQQWTAPAEVELIVVDDSSPVAAEAELAGIPLPSWLRLRVVRQANGGPAAARNRGLDSIGDMARFVAFLDSDDEWQPEHLASGISVLEQGNDFYFCDSAMPPSSLFASTALLGAGPGAEQVERLGAALYRFREGEGRLAMLREYLCQTSAVILRRSVLGDLRFDETLRHAGEDWLMWVRLAHRTSGLCFSTRLNSLRGEGINLYRDAHQRLSASNLRRILTMIRANMLMGEIVGMAPEGVRLTRQRRHMLEGEAAAILLHPGLYREWRDREARAVIAGAWRRLGFKLPWHWSRRLHRKLRSPLLRQELQAA